MKPVERPPQGVLRTTLCIRTRYELEAGFDSPPSHSPPRSIHQFVFHGVLVELGLLVIRKPLNSARNNRLWLRGGF